MEVQILASNLSLASNRCETVLCLVVQSCSTLCSPLNYSSQVPLSMGLSRQEYWSGLPCPPPGDLPNPGIEHRSPTLQVDSLPSEPPGKLRDSWRTVKLCFHRVHYVSNKKKLTETIQKQSFMSARTVSVLFTVIHHSLDLQHWGST